MWLSIDGLEGAGKSTLSRALQERFNDALVSPEFSKGFAGRALSSAVARNPHLISVSGMAQSLFFLAEFVEKVEETARHIRDPHTLVISDRGILSKIVYQQVVLYPLIGRKKTQTLIDLCLEGLPRPDLIIWLQVDIETAKRRIACRGADRTHSDVEFMRRAACQFEILAREYSAIAINTATINAQQVCDRVYSHIANKLPLLAAR